MSIYLEKAQKWLDNPKLDNNIREELTKSLNSEELLTMKK